MSLRHAAILSLSLVSLLLGACANRPAEQAAPLIERPSDGSLHFDLGSGLYRCEMGMEVEVTRIEGRNEHVFIRWTGQEYMLQRDPSASGLPRFEDHANGLVWIDLPWKSVLLDGRTHKPLASECVIAAAS